MFNRKLGYTVSTIVILGVLATASIGATLNNKRTTYLTFNQTVRLPGVSLAAGTYLFELPDPDSYWNVVRVSSADRQRVYLTAFTREIERPATMPLSQHIVFGEGPADAPTPITAWFFKDERTGRQFIY